MDALIKSFLAVYETALLYFFLDILLIRKSERKRGLMAAFFFYFIFQCITYLIDFPFFSTSYYYIAFTLMISLAFYYNDLRIKLLSSSMFVTLNYASKLLAVDIYAIIHRLSISSNPFTYVLNVSTQVIACLIMTAILLVIIGMRSVRDKIMRHIINVLIFILPLTMLYMTMHLLQRIGDMNFYFNVTMILFCYTFFLFFIIDQIIYSNINSTQSKLMQDRLQMQTQYYEDIEKYNQEMSRYKHDMLNHLDNIYGILEHQDIEGAQDYLVSIHNNLQKVKAVINTGNSIIDVIFNSKAALAREYDITYYNNIVVPPHIRINSVDLSIILSNVLDNAIEANQKITKDRFIDSHIHIYKESLFISVSNRFDGNIRFQHNSYLTTKKEQAAHGIGLRNVNYVVNKHGGTMTIEHKDQVFMLSIMLPLEDNEE